MTVSRRSLLLAGAGTALTGLGLVGVAVEERALPGRIFLQRALHLDGKPGAVPDAKPGPVITGRFHSTARGGRTTGWALMLPPAHRAKHGPLPLVVALHGYGETHEDLIGTEFGLPQFLAAHVEAGGVPFSIVAADGGTGYWHPHDGDDAGAMVTDELIPLARRQRGVDPHGKVGFLGWSMGGYGALRLAGLLRSRTCPVVCAESPALWVSASDAPSHGFSTPAEYTRYSVMGRQAQLARTHVMVDCGTGDPFYEAVRHYVAGFPASHRPHAHFEPGGHDAGYWRRRLPADLTFLGRGLRLTAG